MTILLLLSVQCSKICKSICVVQIEILRIHNYAPKAKINIHWEKNSKKMSLAFENRFSKVAWKFFIPRNFCFFFTISTSIVSRPINNPGTCMINHANQRLQNGTIPKRNFYLTILFLLYYPVQCFIPIVSKYLWCYCWENIEQEDLREKI